MLKAVKIYNPPDLIKPQYKKNKIYVDKKTRKTSPPLKVKKVNQLKKIAPIEEEENKKKSPKLKIMKYKNEYKKSLNKQ